MKSLFSLCLLLSSLSTFASTATLVTCSNVSIDVDVETNMYGKTTMTISDNSGKSKVLAAKVTQKSKNNLTVVAITKSIDTHGIMGKGLLLTVSGSEGLLSKDGMIQSLTCDFEPGT